MSSSAEHLKNLVSRAAQEFDDINWPSEALTGAVLKERNGLPVAALLGPPVVNTVVVVVGTASGVTSILPVKQLQF